MEPRQISVAGHFGEWIQGRVGSGGPLVLVTLMCPTLRVHIPGQGVLLSDLFDLAKLSTFLRRLRLKQDFSRLSISHDMPLGAGCGASTAALVALARFGGRELTPGQLAKATLDAEGASDPLMFDEPDQIFWAPREAIVLKDLPPPPLAEIVGGFWGAPEKTNPEDQRFPDISDLIAAWEPACEARDLIRCAALASRSAERCTALRGPADPLPALARKLGALGHCRAHTGSARGLIFPVGEAPPHAEDTLRLAGLTCAFRFKTGCTRTARACSL